MHDSNIQVFDQGGAEREQGLLQILTEMDGFKESTAQACSTFLYRFSFLNAMLLINAAKMNSTGVSYRCN